METLIHEKVYRGEKLLKKMSEQPFVICGVGAIGSNLVENMVRQGFKNFTVIDFDRVDDHNRHTQVWHKRDIGQLKTSVLKNYVYSIMGITVKDVCKKLEDLNVGKLLNKDSIVIDCFDNPESRKLIYDYCKKNNIECLHIGLSMDCAEITWNENYVIPKRSGEDICEYPMARNIIMFSVIVGTESIIGYLRDDIKNDYMVSLNDMKVSCIKNVDSKFYVKSETSSGTTILGSKIIGEFGVKLKNSIGVPSCQRQIL